MRLPTQVIGKESRCFRKMNTDVHADRAAGRRKIMGMYMMFKKACTCGEIDELELCAKSEPKLCYFVRCPRCGRMSAKHREPEEAVKDWNHMEDMQYGESG